jgi:hypothetical protein
MKKLTALLVLALAGCSGVPDGRPPIWETMAKEDAERVRTINVYRPAEDPYPRSPTR